MDDSGICSTSTHIYQSCKSHSSVELWDVWGRSITFMIASRQFSTLNQHKTMWWNHPKTNLAPETLTLEDEFSLEIHIVYTHALGKIRHLAKQFISFTRNTPARFDSSNKTQKTTSTPVRLVGLVPPTTSPPPAISQPSAARFFFFWNAHHLRPFTWTFHGSKTPQVLKMVEGCICIPWKSKDYFLYVFSVKTIVLVRVYNQQFQGTIILMAFDFQGIFICKTTIFIISL